MRALQVGTLQQQAQHEDHELLEGQPPPRQLALCLAHRKMPRAHRLRSKLILQAVHQWTMRSLRWSMLMLAEEPYCAARPSIWLI